MLTEAWLMQDRGRHEFWQAGIYVTPSLETACWYMLRRHGSLAAKNVMLGLERSELVCPSCVGVSIMLDLYAVETSNVMVVVNEQWKEYIFPAQFWEKLPAHQSAPYKDCSASLWSFGAKYLSRQGCVIAKLNECMINGKAAPPMKNMFLSVLDEDGTVQLKAINVKLGKRPVNALVKSWALMERATDLSWSARRAAAEKARRIPSSQPAESVVWYTLGLPNAAGALPPFQAGSFLFTLGGPSKDQRIDA
eukprot:s373_g43.t1